MECFVAPRRLRIFVTSVSFGAILLWILLGSYVRHHDQPSAAASSGGERGLGRHLLSSPSSSSSSSSSSYLFSSQSSLLGNESRQLDCPGLGMYYENGGRVNLEDDQVSCRQRVNESC